MGFQIDGSDVKDPIDFAYEERYAPLRDAQGSFMVSEYRVAVARFNKMTPAEYEDWCNAADGAAHTIRCYAPTTTTLTDYTGIIVEYISSDISTGLYYYGSEFKVSHISPNALPAFGA